MKDKSVGRSSVGPDVLLRTTRAPVLSILGVILFSILAFIVAVLTLGTALIFVWPVSMIWAELSASNQDSRYQAWLAGR